MRVEIHNGFKDAITVPATHVVVYDEFDVPIAAVIHVHGSQYVAATAANPEFKKVLKAMGIDKTFVLKLIDPARLKPI